MVKRYSAWTFHSQELRAMREQYETVLCQIDDLKLERDRLEQEMRDATGGCDCFANYLPCNGHPGR
jgi:hypothetical protein